MINVKRSLLKRHEIGQLFTNCIIRLVLSLNPFEGKRSLLFIYKYICIMTVSVNGKSNLFYENLSNQIEIFFGTNLNTFRLRDKRGRMLESLVDTMDSFVRIDHMEHKLFDAHKVCMLILFLLSNKQHISKYHLKGVLKPSLFAGSFLKCRKITITRLSESELEILPCSLRISAIRALGI